VFAPRRRPRAGRPHLTAGYRDIIKAAGGCSRHLGEKVFLARIAVGIPSYCEVESIRHVVEAVDNGLASLRAPADCLIVNMDGCSEDGTGQAFLDTPTACPKLLLDIPGPPSGKGANVLPFLALCDERQVEAAALIDADVTSAAPEWIRSLLEPVLSGRAGMVFPVYARHRFDGATTNLFAYPLIAALCHSSVRQPIGGEIGLGPDLIRLALRSPVPTPAYGYGIDVFLALLWLGTGHRAAQVKLGRKIHKPSHPKRDLIFVQVAAALLATLRNLVGNGAWAPGDSLTETCTDAGIDADTSTAPPAALSAQVAEAQRQVSSHLPEYDWTQTDLRPLCEGQPLTEELWADLLADWVAAGLTRPTVDAVQHATRLLPLYYLRMQAFWRDIAHLTPSAIEDYLAHSISLLARGLSCHSSLMSTVINSPSKATRPQPHAASHRISSSSP